MTRRIAQFCASVSVLALAACQNPSEPANKEAASTPAATEAAAETRDVLPTTASPVSYEFVITPDLKAHTFSGEAKLVFDVREPTDRIVVDGIDLAMNSTEIDGEAAKAEIQADRQRIEFVSPTPLDVGRHDMTVSYTGKIYEQSAGPFYVDYPTADGTKTMLATQFEPGDARRLAPMWDEPALKATFKMSIVVPADMDAVSNTPIEKTTDAGDGMKRVDFAETPKMSSYLLYLGAGDFSRISREAGGVEHGVITKAGDEEKGRYALNASVDILNFYNDYFGVPYPLPKLDHIAVPGAGGFGAMENWGAIMYFDRALLLDPKVSTPRDKRGVFGVVAHEMAHQWFGDLVTMAWWNDIWLNEGFASWMASKTTEHFHPEWDPWLRAAGGRESAMSVDAFASTHPIVQRVRNIEEANLAFDSITYRKGQAVIRMIESYVGEDDFRSGVRAYMRDHAYGNTTSADLWSAVGAASDTPVLDIARDFTTQPGIPMIVVGDVICDEDRDVSTVTLSQSRFAADAASKADERVWRTPVTAASVEKGELSRALIAGPDAQTLEVNGCGAVKVNAGETSYFRTDYPDTAFDALETSWDSLKPADQLGLLDDAYALGKNGDAPFTRFFELAEHVSADANPVVVTNVANRLGELRDFYNDRPDQDTFAAFARTWLTSVLERLGWDRSADDSDNVVSLRASVIGTLAYLGDQAVIDEARRRFAAYEEDSNVIGADMLRTIVNIVAENADEATFEKLRQHARDATNRLEQRMYLLALTQAQDENLVTRTLELALTDEVPTQLRARLIEAVGEEHPELAWSFYGQHREEIDGLLDALSRLDYPARLVSHSLNAETADNLESFAKEYLPESALPAIQRTVDRIRYNAKVRESRLPEVDAWLAAHAG